MPLSAKQKKVAITTTKAIIWGARKTVSLGGHMFTFVNSFVGGTAVELADKFSGNSADRPIAKAAVSATKGGFKRLNSLLGWVDKKVKSL